MVEVNGGDATRPPTHVGEGAGDQLNRNERDALGELIRRYLNDELSAFQLDEALDEYHETQDAAVRYVCEQLWYLYDDCDDHQVVLEKAEWDFIQRLLLLLESDHRVVSTKHWEWHWTQAVALLALVGFGLVAFTQGWGEHLFIASIPFGIVSLVIGQLRIRRYLAAADSYRAILFPFATFGELRRAYEQVGFRKIRYPQHLRGRRIRSQGSEVFWNLYSVIFCLICSPLPLLAQSVPQSNPEHRAISR